MKQFNLDEYNRLKAEGKEPRIVTRDGRNVRIICTDVKDEDFPVIALINNDNLERVTLVARDGKFFPFANNDSDLFFADLDEEPKYRPYANAEECFADAMKHGGWIKDDKIYAQVLDVRNDEINTHYAEITFDGLLADCVWADDNTPCGVKEG